MTSTMPNTPVGMTSDDLRDLMAANGVENASQLAKLLEVNQSTAWRWLNDERRIDRAAAALIRSVLTKKPKK